MLYTLMSPLVNPTNRRSPRVFQARELTEWNLGAFCLVCFPSVFCWTFSSLNYPSATTGESFDSKSQTSHPSSVPMAIHLHLGLKAKAVIDPFAS